MDADARAYSSLNKPQFEMGSDFLRVLNVSKGDKVLDMGCGTGELAKFIADIVGADGEVVGVDPDEARIKVAQEKFRNVHNIKFLVGNSVTGFPHDNDQYYDLHFSSHVFQWVRGDEKKVYLEKAYHCLKSGGRIAILTGVKEDLKIDAKIAVEFLPEAEYIRLFRDVGSFSDVVTEKLSYAAHFDSFEEFAALFKATCHLDVTEMGADFQKDFLAKCSQTESDGSFTFEMKELVRITGKKKIDIGSE